MDKDLLWFDDSPDRTVAQKVAMGAWRYYCKFGVKPNRVKVHLSQVPQELETRFTIIPDKATLRHHFLIGRIQKNDTR